MTTKVPKIHLAHQRNPEGTIYDAKCGIWNPEKVTSFINLVTCKSCLRIAKASPEGNGNFFKNKVDNK